jgi:hypothetical protein
MSFLIYIKIKINLNLHFIWAVRRNRIKKEVRNKKIYKDKEWNNNKQSVNNNDNKHKKEVILFLIFSTSIRKFRYSWCLLIFFKSNL